MVKACMKIFITALFIEAKISTIPSLIIISNVIHPWKMVVLQTIKTHKDDFSIMLNIKIVDTK